MYNCKKSPTKSSVNKEDVLKMQTEECSRKFEKYMELTAEEEEMKETRLIYYDETANSG